MRYSLSLLMVLVTMVAHTQTSVERDVTTLLQGCWTAGDGGMEGQYCFDENGLLRVKPKGRISLQRHWEYDEKKALLVISKGGKPIKYTVEVLNDSSFVLHEIKHDVRLIGMRER